MPVAKAGRSNQLLVGAGRWWGGCIVLLVVAMTSHSHDAAASETRPPMFAAYYVWYSTGDGPHRAWNQWGTSGSDADFRSAAYPLAGPYDSDDPEIVRWHIRLAKGSGISAFLVSWWGPGRGQKVPGLTEKSFEVVLRVAEEERFHVAL